MMHPVPEKQARISYSPQPGVHRPQSGLPLSGTGSMGPVSGLNPNMLQLDTSQHSAGSRHSTVTLGGVEYPIGARIGKKGQFVIGDPDTSRHSRSFESSLPSVTDSQAQIFPSMPKYRSKGYRFEQWNFNIIRFVCFLFVLAIMIALLAGVIALCLEHNRDCEAKFLWWQGSTFYALPVTKFYDSDNDQVGDIVGVTRKEGYLEYMGIGAVVLSEFLWSDDVSWDRVASFTDVDPRVGTMTEFEEMSAKLEDDKIRRVIKLSLWCTSLEHAWFRESRESSSVAGGPHSAFYVWKQTRPPQEVTQWQYDGVRGEFYLHGNDSSCPLVNWANHRVHASLEEILSYWLDRGVSGFHLTHLEKYHVESKLTLLTILDLVRGKLDQYSMSEDNRKILILDGSFIDHIETERVDILDDILSLADLVETPLSLDPENRTLGLVGQVEAGLKWQRRPDGPWTYWNVTGLVDLDVADVLPFQMFSLVLPGTPVITAGQEIGTFFFESREDTKPMLWDSGSIFPYLPEREESADSVQALHNISIWRSHAYALRWDETPQVVSQEDRITYKALESDSKLDYLLYTRYFGSRDSYFYAVNYGDEPLERNFVKYAAHWGEILSDSTARVHGKSELDRVTLDPKQAIVFRITN